MSLLNNLLKKFSSESPTSRRRLSRSIHSQLQALESRLLLDAVGFQFADPHPEHGNRFGETVTPLTNGNVVVTSPNDDLSGGSVTANTGAGAVYLFDGVTGNLISTLSGAASGDQIGSGGVTALTNGNFVVDSPNWNGGRGAVTFVDGINGLTASVSMSNSLVGSSTVDQVGLPGVTALSNGNYVVVSTSFKNNAALNAGAVTWGSGITGISGAVSATNSLVGGVQNDNVGSGGVTELANGNFVVASPSVSTTSVTNVGAVTWFNGGIAVKGLINAQNSVIGSSANDQVGLGGITPLSNGNYVIDSDQWNNGGIATAGAVTWANGITGLIGKITTANSLVGSTAADQVGLGGVTALSSGNYVVDSYLWNNGSVTDAGAVTFADGSIGLIGTISAANSLVGTTANDQVGGNVAPQTAGVTALANGNYVVASPNWTNGTIANAGAATWGSGLSGIAGALNSTNSLVGDLANDFVGFNGTTALLNGNYVVVSSQWNTASATDVGAVTWGSGLTGIHGTVSSTNSLVGGSTADNAGDGGITALTNGYYVVSSPNWHNGSVVGAGAATWGNGAAGTKGTIGSSNSLIGTATNDQIGSGGIAALTNGNYVVDSNQWNNNRGAVTKGSGTAPLAGTISVTNSLIGSTSGDQVGSNGVIPLNDGNYVVDSSQWNNGTGAVTFAPGTGLAGTVGSNNSLVGSIQGDQVGDGGVTPLGNGNFVVTSLSWNSGHGAITSGGALINIKGALNASTSITNIFSVANNANAISIVSDDLNNAVYAIVTPNNGVDFNSVGGASSAAGLLPLQQTGFGVIQVSSYNGDPAQIPLANALVGVNLVEVITVTNVGSGPLTIQPAFMVPFGDPAENALQVQLIFLTNFTDGQIIAPGASASILISPDTTSAVFTGGDVDIPNDSNGDAIIHAGGLVTQPALTVMQGTTQVSGFGDTVDLGNTMLGTPATATLTIKNVGNATARITGVTLPAGFTIVGGANLTIGVILPAQTSTTFVLQLNATVIGSVSGTVAIQSNSATVQFSVKGSVTAPKLLVKQGLTLLTNGVSMVNAGNTHLNTPLTTVISITNVGSAPLQLQPVTVPAGFSVVGNFTANQPLAIGATTSFTLKLNATAAGNPTGVVTITDSDPAARTFTFNVTGFVRPTAQAPLLVVQRGSTPLVNATNQVIFNSVSPGTAVQQTITVFNLGNTDLIVQPLTPPAGFSVVKNFTANQHIPAGARFDLTIQLNANPVGTPKGIVTFNTNDSLAPQFKINVVTNHRPTAVSVNPNVAGAQLATTVKVGSLSTTDPDNTVVTQSYNYSVVSPMFVSGSTAAPVFTVDSRGTLTLAAGAPVGVYSNVSVTSTDQGGAAVVQNQTLYITGVSTIGVPASTSVIDHTSAGYTIATLPARVVTINSANGQSTSHAQRLSPAVTSSNQTSRTINLLTFKLGNSADDKAFTIDSTGHLRTTMALNAASKNVYHLDFTSKNALTGEITNYTYNVNVASLVKQSVVVHAATFRVAEGTVNGTTVGTVTSTATGGTYSIVAGNSGGAFSINATTGQISIANSDALSFAKNQIFSLTIQNLANGTFGLATVNINVARVTLSNATIAANAAIGTVIGQLNTTQLGGSGPYLYFLPAGSSDNSAFTIDSTGRVKLNTQLNAAVQSSYEIAVNSIDATGQSIASTLIITVVGNSTVSLSNTTVSQSATIGTVIGQLSVTNNSAGNPFTFSLPTGVLNNSAFAMNSSGQLIVNTTLNAATKSAYSIQVNAKDQNNLTLTGTFTITVTTSSPAKPSASMSAKSSSVSSGLSQNLSINLK